MLVTHFIEWIIHRSDIRCPPHKHQALLYTRLRMRYQNNGGKEAQEEKIPNLNLLKLAYSPMTTPFDSFNPTGSPRMYSLSNEDPSSWDRTSSMSMYMSYLVERSETCS